MLRFPEAAVRNVSRLHRTDCPSILRFLQKVKSVGLGDLDGDGVQESAFEEIKGKISSLFGGK